MSTATQKLDYASPSSALTLSKPPRLLSLDAYRGAVMLLMASELMQIPRAAGYFPNSSAWIFIGHQMDHLPWAGCTLWDMIQPSFMFMVGVAVPFSLAARQARGNSFGRMFFHALWRALLLGFLGILLASIGQLGFHQRPNANRAGIPLSFPACMDQASLASHRSADNSLFLLACLRALPYSGTEFQFFRRRTSPRLAAPQRLRGPLGQKLQSRLGV